MAENRTLFYVSGLIAFSLFIFVLSLFFYMMFSSQELKVFALTKDNYISISIDMPKVEKKSVKKSANTPIEKEKLVQHPIPDAIVLETAKPIPAPVDVGNLFNNVWTKDIKKQKIKEKTLDNKRIQEIQKKINLSKNNEAKNSSKNVSGSDDMKTDEKNNNKSTSNEVNEYLAKIQALVYTYFNPPQNSQGNSVKAVIELSSIGKVLDFRVLNYSVNSSLNEECDKIKDRLMSVVFPVNPQSKSGNYIIILTSKE